MKYLSEIMTALPKDCIFNKVNCGVGGTTLAIRSEEKYIILVPYVTNVLAKEMKESNSSLYISKDMYTIEDTLVCNKSFICQGNGYETITKDTKTIMATYESLPSLIKNINPAEWNLLVDEFHCLIKNYRLRRAAVSFIANHFEDFKSYCFMSATVPSILPSWMKFMQIVTPTIEETQIDIEVSNKLTKYNFFNSLSGIASLYDKNDLVFYSKNSNRKDLPFTRAEITDGFGDRNWFTSVCFECIDIDEVVDEITVVIDQNKYYTIVDLDDIKQIVGRFRNCNPKVNLYIINGKVNQVVGPTIEEKTRQAELLDAVNKVAKIQGEYFAEMNTYLQMYECYNYYNGEFYMDSMIDTYYKLINSKLEWFLEFRKNVTPIMIRKNVTKTTSIGNLETLKSLDEIDVNNKHYSTIAKAIEIMGIENVRRCGTLKALKQKMIDYTDMLGYKKVQLKLNLKVGEFYATKDLKERMKDIGLSGTANNVIPTYYYTEEVVKKINGVAVRGLIIRGRK